MLEKINDTISYIRTKTNISPEVGIILGTGLGGLVKKINIECVIDYQNIPYFPVSTVEGHKGRLIFGEISGKKVIVMQGRFHFYEGYTMQEVTYPVRIMKSLGINYLFISNASGGVNPDFEIGDLMVITDHINLIPNPLIGKNYDDLGPRFPDMSCPYDKELISKAEHIAHRYQIKIQKGVYTAVTGPSLETPAEYKYFRIIGSDTVGMSTVPEVIVARHANIRCFAISVITDLGVEGKIVKVTHEDVQRAAEKSEPQMTFLICQLISEL